MAYERPDPLIDTIAAVLQAGGLTEAFRWRWRLARIWAQVAGEPLASQSWVLGYRDGVLSLGIATPALATRLRFGHDRLVKRLRAHGLADATGLTYRVQPMPVDTGRRRGRRYSADAADRVAQTAASEVADPELAASLNRLARHLQPPKDRDPPADDPP